jgi:hypothetical protein
LPLALFISTSSSSDAESPSTFPLSRRHRRPEASRSKPYPPSTPSSFRPPRYSRLLIRLRRLLQVGNFFRCKRLSTRFWL